MSNALVAQSGGPSPVINASLQGVIETSLSFPDHITKIYAGWHGIEGVLLEELIDLTEESAEEIGLLSHTPAAGAIGTCRYKLKEEGHKEDFDRIIDVFRAHDIRYFFYIGGNDSMDTACKVSRLAASKGYDLVVTGVPKTIDNDMGDENFGLIDHTPGYASAARYWAYLIQNIDEENRSISVSECVSVIQAMGRQSGFITAASRLADPCREMPLQLYMAEAGHDLESLADNVNKQLIRSGRCIVVVNEGFAAGNIGNSYDGFGHVEYGASQTTAAQVVINYLNRTGLKARGQATCQVPGVIQRSTSIHASIIDIEEAYEVGKKAVEIAIHTGTGWMATILRAPGETYKPVFEKVRLEEVANTVRFLPASWISKDKLDVTDDFIKYAMPLIGVGWPKIRLENGLQRFARFRRKFADKKLPPYMPIGLR